ncbi:MAG: hypothetical protein EP335_18620 [Alphaproteobacteria bacterium]|nr:MAG: hypothetical protein EP335_18620 [Alphaproteobacteria bacterium]
MSEDNLKMDSQGGGSGKMLLVLGLLGGLALGGGLGYFYSKQSGGDQPTANGEHAAKPEKPKGELMSVVFERLAVPIYSHRNDSSRFVGNYFVDITVETRGNDNQITVKKAEPRLQHAFLSAISKNDLMREDAPLELDVDKAGTVLKDKADEVLGAGIVERVLVTNAMRLTR